MSVKHWFGYWCKHCQKARHLEGEDLKRHQYKGINEDGYYENHVDCPGCGKHLVFLEKSIFAK